MKTFEELSGAVITEGTGCRRPNIVTANPLHTVRKPGGVGIPFPDNDVRIVDLDDPSKEMPLGSRASCCAGPTVMRGVLEKPGGNREDLRRRVVGDRRYRLPGFRRSYLHRRPQEGHDPCPAVSRWNPREIDELMYGHPKVLQACSFGIPR